MGKGADLLAAQGIVDLEDAGCPNCHDTGVLIVLEDGREYARRCVPCAVRAWDKLAAARFKAGLTWPLWVKRPELRDVVKSLWEWEGSPWCVLLHGDDKRGSDNRGAGKTHAAIATARRWVERGRYASAWHWPSYMQRMRASMTDESLTPAPPDVFDGLLVIDDVGERDVHGQPERAPTRWEVELLTLIVTVREAASRPTIVTTNLGLAELNRKFYRSADRMASGLRLRWVAESWRRR